jgi:hypothetical protein
MVWSELDEAFEEYKDIPKSKHEGTILIGYDFFVITEGLADYFPLASPPDYARFQASFRDKYNWRLMWQRLN